MVLVHFRGFNRESPWLNADCWLLSVHSQMKIAIDRLASGFFFLILLSALLPAAPVGAAQAVKSGEDVLSIPGEVGRRGGRLVAALRSTPKTLNPVIALDLPSKEVSALLFADLIHINLSSQRTEPAL